MPFKAEFNFFYRWLRLYLKDKHKIEALRSDEQFLAKPLFDKIKDQILKADFIIADITGNNPNVFFELGLSQSQVRPKPIILLCHHAHEKEVPVDIQLFEFISYNQAHPDEFSAKLDNAVLGIYHESYESFHQKASEILHRFKSEMRIACETADRKEFQARVMQGEGKNEVPSENDERSFAHFLLLAIIEDVRDPSTINAIMNWLDIAFPMEE